MRKIKQNKKIWQVLGSVWASALLLSLSLALPGISHAATIQQGTTQITVDVSEQFIVTTPSEINVDMLASEIDSVVTATLNVGVISSVPGGYSMYLSMAQNDAYNGALVHETLTSPVARIPAAPGTFAAPSALSQNSWGYSLEGWSAGSFAAVPAFAAADIVANETSAGTFNTPIQIGVWAGFIPTGTYTNSIVVLVSAND
jgi:hypothetical protein